jgi:uncharacterized low-complexity protein
MDSDNFFVTIQLTAIWLQNCVKDAHLHLYTARVFLVLKKNSGHLNSYNFIKLNLRRQMKKINKTAFAVGTSVVAGLCSTMVNANNNPFGMSELSSGYMNIAEADVELEGAKKMKDGACGEGKCGNKMSGTEEKAKAKEGKCGEGKCGDKKKDKTKAVEGKCGEGKCGDKK